MKNKNADIVCLCTRHGIGGTSINADMLTEAFRERGYKAELGFLFEDEKDFKKRISDYFIVYHKEPQTPVEWFEFLFECKKKLGSLQPKASLSFQPLANIIAPIFMGWTGKSVTRQAWPADQQSKSTEKIESILVRTPLVYSNVACSNFIANSYPHRGLIHKKKTKVVYNAPTRLNQIEESIEHCRNHFGMVSNGIILGALGRLHEQKNFQLAIRAMPYIPGAELYIAGDGEQRIYLQELSKSLGVESRVHFLGKINGNDVTRFLKSVDLLLMPSIYEGHPLVMLEALSIGVPVLAHDIPVMREAGGEAVLYSDSNPINWANKIKTNVNKSLESMKNAGLKRAFLQTKESMVDSYLEAMGLSHFK